MRQKRRAVTYVLAAILTISTLWFPTETVRGEELPTLETVENTSMFDDMPDETDRETEFEKVQDQENNAAQDAEAEDTVSANDSEEEPDTGSEGAETEVGSEGQEAAEEISETTVVLESEESNEAGAASDGMSGTCGDKLTWELVDGTLTISGTGRMDAFDVTGGENPPWYEKRDSIETVIIQEGVTSIGSYAFYECSHLTEASIPKGVHIYGMGIYAFARCSSLKGITFPSGGRFIYIGVFEGCSSLTEITIPDGVETIEREAFKNCTSLKKITIPNSATWISCNAFEGCSSLTEIIIPDGVKCISWEAFKDCTSLEKITIPNSVTRIEYSVFEGCSSLEKIMIPNSVTRIEYSVFRGCTSLVDVTIPEGVTTIDSDAFNGCSSMSQIAIPGTVSSIGEGAFKGCSGLREIMISEGVNVIGNNAFYGCSSLTEIIIPNGVTAIGNSAFERCSSLTEITIPDSIDAATSCLGIGRRAFYYCFNLKDIYCLGTRGHWDSISVLIERVDEFDYNNGNKRAKVHCIDDPTVTYDANGGTGEMESVRLTIRDKYQFPKCRFTGPEGREFKAWSIEGTLYAPYKTCDITVDTVVKAEWMEKEFVVSYDANGGTGVMDAVSVKEGTAFTLPDCAFTPPKGMEFKAWSIEGTLYAPYETCDITADTVVKAEWMEKEFVVSYDANGGTGVMDAVSVKEGTAFTLPDCAFIPPEDREFKAWEIGGTEYNPGDSFTVNADVTAMAIWTETEVLPPSPPPAVTDCTLTGAITGHKGIAYASISARLEGLEGKSYFAVVTGGENLDGTDKKKCTYFVSAPAGQYTLVVEAVTSEGVVVNRTALVKLKGSGQTKDINLPNGQAKTKVNINKKGQMAAVGGMDDLITDSDGGILSGDSAEVTFTVDAVDESNLEAAEIQNAASGQTLETFEFSVSKRVDGMESRITDTGDVTLEIILPFESSGKANVNVYRYHNGSVDVLTTQERGGEKIAIDDNSITIYAKKFSVYAIAYDSGQEVSPTEPGGSSGGGSSSGGGGASSGDNSSSNSNFAPAVTFLAGAVLPPKPPLAGTVLSDMADLTESVSLMGAVPSTQIVLPEAIGFPEEVSSIGEVLPEAAHTEVLSQAETAEPALAAAASSAAFSENGDMVRLGNWWLILLILLILGGAVYFAYKKRK